MAKKSKAELLAESNDMTPVAGSVEVRIPVAVLWECFTQANLWPRWNRCFFWARNRSLLLGRQLIWCFQPIRWWYLYKMPAIAKIIEVEEKRKVTWEVTALPGFYARHTYFMEDLGNGQTRFGSWEKARGWSFRLMKWFWVRHFVFVKDHSLAGARFLEETYRRTGRLDETTIKANREKMNRIQIGLMAGLITAVITTAINLLSRALGLLPEVMDLKHLAEFVINPLANPAGALALGSLIHVMAGGIVGIIYALLVRPYTPKSGVLFMLAFWLVLMLVVSPLAHRGFFGLALGPALPIWTFVLHVIFGGMMGLIAGRINDR